MRTLHRRIDGLVRRHPRLVVAAWVIVLLAALPFAARQSEGLTGGGFSAPGSQSAAVEAALAEDFPGVPRGALAAVLIRERADAPLAPAVDRLDRVARAAEHVELTEAARTAALRGQESVVVVPLALSTSDDGASDVAADLREALAIGDGPRDGVTTALVGQGALWAGMQELSKRDLERAEVVGFPLVALILLAVFGSLAAAALPLLLGAFSVLLTGALIFGISRQAEMSVFVTNMASMIGIGVAVDYSLFVLARFREEIAAGREPDAARAIAMATSGTAVVFSGLTVIVSLAGLYLIPNTAIRSMALGAILVVAVSVLASSLLLPALIRLLGRRVATRSRVFGVLGLVARSRAPRRRGSTRPGAAPHPGFWARWTATVTRRPALSAFAASAVLLVLALPALELRTGNGALRQFPADDPTRVGFEAAATVAGPGSASPLRVVVPTTDAAAVERVRATLAAQPELLAPGAPVTSADGRSTLVTAVPRTDGEGEAVKAAVERLRAALPEAAVGGITAQQVDLRELIGGSMWKIVLFVLGMSYLVLLVLLRSVVLPLKAVVMNLLSVGAAYGVLVAVFQYGWFDGLGGFESLGYVDTLTPPLVLAVVFGLSMDYEVFLLSRIRERFDATGDTATAVAQGLAGSARTITSAALIMVAVFAVFVGTGVPSIKQIGVGCAVAIALDATLVRLVLVPAAMELMGRWNWYLPRALDRVLPDAGIERAPAPAAAA